MTEKEAKNNQTLSSKKTVVFKFWGSRFYFFIPEKYIRWKFNVIILKFSLVLFSGMGFSRINLLMEGSMRKCRYRILWLHFNFPKYLHSISWTIRKGWMRAVSWVKFSNVGGRRVRSAVFDGFAFSLFLAAAAAAAATMSTQQSDDSVVARQPWCGRTSVSLQISSNGLQWLPRSWIRKFAWWSSVPGRPEAWGWWNKGLGA